MRSNLLSDIDFFGKPDSHFNCRRGANSSCSSNACVSGSAIGSAYKDTSPDRTDRSEDRLLVRDTFDGSHSSARQVPKNEPSSDLKLGQKNALTSGVIFIGLAEPV